MLDSQSTSLTFYGHCAFLWQTSQGLRVLSDPYRNIEDRYWFTRLFPQVECDLGLITHAHFDHDAAERLPESASLLRSSGQLQIEDMSIKGIMDIHSGASVLRGMRNVMFLLETGGLRFLHIGDNRGNWPEDVSQGVGKVDVLLVTVDDSSHLLSYAEVDSMIERVDPRIVIPMQYRIPSLMPESCGLKSPNQWLATQSIVKQLKGHRAKISKKELPPSSQVWVFEPSPESLTAKKAEW